MNIKAKVFTLALIVAFLNSCAQKVASNKLTPSNINYELLINEYLNKRRVEPNATINVTTDSIIFNDLKIYWKQLEGGVLVTVNGHTINTSQLVTLNDVWGEESKDSLNFANSLSQIKYYEVDDSRILGFVLTSEPCTGLGCGVNYQILYDMPTKKVSCFGRFRTGYDLDLYNFDDDKVDYLSKTFFGRNEQLRDTTVFHFYQREADGSFELAKDTKGKAFYFKHMYSNESDTIPENFEEKWVVNIKDSR